MKYKIRFSLLTWRLRCQGFQTIHVSISLTQLPISVNQILLMPYFIYIFLVVSTVSFYYTVLESNICKCTVKILHIFLIILFLIYAIVFNFLFLSYYIIIFGLINVFFKIIDIVNKVFRSIKPSKIEATQIIRKQN